MDLKSDAGKEGDEDTPKHGWMQTGSPKQGTKRARRGYFPVSKPSSTTCQWHSAHEVDKQVLLRGAEHIVGPAGAVEWGLLRRVAGHDRGAQHPWSQPIQGRTGSGARDQMEILDCPAAPAKATFKQGHEGVYDEAHCLTPSQSVRQEGLARPRCGLRGRRHCGGPHPPRQRTDKG